MRKRTRCRFRPRWDHLDERCLLAGYTPAQIKAAYGLNAISFTSPSGAMVGGDGTGQTIALVEVYHDPNIQQSLNAFDAAYGLPTITLDVINQAGNQTDAGWAGEESMDVEWAHAIAPGANIVVVEAAPGNNDTQGFNDFMTAVQTASQTKGVTAVSMSLGMDEYPGESASDSAFTTPGITFIASSGDFGAVEWPASAPGVLAVGGTTLNLSGSGVYGVESGWVNSGGGLSQDEVEPSYQDAVQSTGKRSTPDVSFDADPYSGVSTYIIPPTSAGGGGQWFVAGGTSLGAPAWAAIMAIVSEGRAVAGHTSLSGGTQTLPALYALPSTAFHKVALNSSQGSEGGGSNQAINTGVYNTQAGLGTPVGPALIGGLVSGSTTSAPTTPPPPPPPPSPPSSPPAIPKPPPFTTPVPITDPNPVYSPPEVPAPAPIPAPPPGPAPPTPPPAAAPVAVVVPQKKRKAAPKKHRSKPVHVVARPKLIGTRHERERARFEITDPLQQ